MKIVHIVESTATGTLSMLCLAANAQKDAGNDVIVIYSKRPETPSDLQKHFRSGVELKNVQMSSFQDKLKSLFAVRKLWKQHNPDVVFMHSSFGGFIGRLAGLGLRGRCFYLPHCISLMRQDITWFHKVLFSALEWVAAVKSATYVACSQSEAFVIRKYIPFRKCMVVENAVDTSSWDYGKDWDVRENKVVTVGQVRSQKDPLRFCQIALEVKKSNPDIEFIWIGDGDSVYKTALTESGVKVLGWKRPEEVKKILSEVKYYLSTALWEGMPVAPIEGMLSGNVAVLSNCAGNVDIVKSGETGFIFDTVDSAAEMILRVSQEKDLGDMVSKAGHKHCADNYCVARYLKDVESLLM